MRQDELYEDMTAEQESETPSTVTSLDNQPKEKWLKKRTIYKVKVCIDRINLNQCINPICHLFTEMEHEGNQIRYIKDEN